MRGKPIPEPRRIGEHVSRALDYLREHGAHDVRVFKTTHVVIAFRIGRHALEVRTACTPRDEGNAFRHFLTDLRHVVERIEGAR